MKTPKDMKDMQHKINAVIDSADHLEKANLSPFFKEKTMQRMFAKQPQKQPVFLAWFTPKLQLATLVGFVLLNVFAFMNLNSSTYNDNVQEFADSYGLSVSSDYSVLN